MLRRLKATTAAGIYVLLDFHPFLDVPLHVRLIKDIAQSYEQAPRPLSVVMAENVAALRAWAADRTVPAD